MEKINDLPTKSALTAILLGLAAGAGWADDGRDGVRFQATLQTTSKLILPPEGRCKGPTLKVVGAGDTNLFGAVYVEQSHCLGESGKFFDGVFKLSKIPPPLPHSARSLIEGRYCGSLVPTFNSTFPPPAPLGTWLIAGSVCITKTVLGRVDSHCSPPPSDCSPPPKGYEPATGISDLTTGSATIFLDKMIRFR